MEIRNRIKELRYIKASELVRNPNNWRKHPDKQSKALQGALSEIGYADALIAYQTDEGLTLIDGHLRADTTPDVEVPVLVTDLDQHEADKLLATLDPLSALAEPDYKQLETVLHSVTIESEPLIDMVRSMLVPTKFLEDALQADEEGKPFPTFDGTIEDEGPPTDGLVNFIIRVSPDQRMKIMQAVNKCKEKIGLEMTADAIVAISQEYVEN
jgi:hypothetical protein